MTQTLTAPANIGLQSKALLANLNISAWSGRKHDKKATREVEENHNAQHGEAGRFNKMLTSKEFLAPILKAAGAARTFLYDNTLPWGDNGDRILPSANYMDFCKGMGTLKSEFYTEVEKAQDTFTDELIKAEVRLNGLFNREDYPTSEEFRSKFAFNVSFMPMPESSDIRLDISETEVNVIRQSVESEINNRINAATANIWERIKDQLLQMKDRFTSTNEKGEPAIFRNSLFDNLSDLIDLLPKLNVTGNADIDQICEEMKGLLIDPEKVRTSAQIRSRKADEVSALLNKFSDFFPA